MYFVYIDDVHWLYIQSILNKEYVLNINELYMQLIVF